jgi:hypothetical protein
MLLQTTRLLLQEQEQLRHCWQVVLLSSPLLLMQDTAAAPQRHVRLGTVKCCMLPLLHAAA